MFTTCNYHRTHKLQSLRVFIMSATTPGNQPPVQEPFSWRDIHSLKFLIQFLFSAIILGFCLFQIVERDRDDPNNPLYWSCITGILALWMPSPATVASAGHSSASYPMQPVEAPEPSALQPQPPAFLTSVSSDAETLITRIPRLPKTSEPSKN
jgi:hypothetical protein